MVWWEGPATRAGDALTTTFGAPGEGVVFLVLTAVVVTVVVGVGFNAKGTKPYQISYHDAVN